MNDLLNVIHVENLDGIFVVSSLDVAERFGKQHNHILRDIERLREDVANFGQMFFAGQYVDGYGRSQPCYSMNRDGFSLLAMGFTGSEALSWKLKFIEAFNAMEKQWNSPEIVIARALVMAKEQLAAKDQQIAALEPKAAFYDVVADGGNALSFSEAVRLLNLPGTGQNTLFRILREARVLMSNNRPYQTFMDRGYFRVIEQHYSKPDGTTMVSFKTLITQPKGLQFVRGLLQGVMTAEFGYPKSDFGYSSRRKESN